MINTSLSLSSCPHVSNPLKSNFFFWLRHIVFVPSSSPNTLWARKYAPKDYPCHSKVPIKSDLLAFQPEKNAQCIQIGYQGCLLIESSLLILRMTRRWQSCYYRRHAWAYWICGERSDGCCSWQKISLLWEMSRDRASLSWAKILSPLIHHLQFVTWLTISWGKEKCQLFTHGFSLPPVFDQNWCPSHLHFLLQNWVGQFQREESIRPDQKEADGTASV